MRNVVLSVLTGTVSLLWLALLVATDFNGLVIGVGLLAALVVIGRDQIDDLYGPRHG
jgi:hypothetical protein